jgi:hypothetical protein
MEKLRLLFVKQNLCFSVLTGLRMEQDKGKPDEPEPALAD